MPLTRRHIFACAPAAAAWLVSARSVAKNMHVPAISAGLAALEQHRSQIIDDDVVGVVDFSRHSRDFRFHLVDRIGGKITSLLVAHGRGSDPNHTGFVEHFSNLPGSFASSDGAYMTRNEYVGQHGRSMRLQGLENRNNNAEPRAIVVHAAWYVSDHMIRTHGKLGRSEGCFAVQQSDLDPLLARLGAGRLLYGYSG
jgi:hypothetical protein